MSLDKEAGELLITQCIAEELKYLKSSSKEMLI